MKPHLIGVIQLRLQLNAANRSRGKHQEGRTRGPNIPQIQWAQSTRASAMSLLFPVLPNLHCSARPRALPPELSCVRAIQSRRKEAPSSHPAIQLYRPQSFLPSVGTPYLGETSFRVSLLKEWKRGPLSGEMGVLTPAVLGLGGTGPATSLDEHCLGRLFSPWDTPPTQQSTLLHSFTLCGFSYPQSTMVLKYYTENPRNKQFISFKSHAVLSRVMQSCIPPCPRT